jgi:hypothetical protein
MNDAYKADCVAQAATIANNVSARAHTVNLRSDGSLPPLHCIRSVLFSQTIDAGCWKCDLVHIGASLRSSNSCSRHLRVRNLCTSQHMQHCNLSNCTIKCNFTASNESFSISSAPSFVWKHVILRGNMRVLLTRQRIV